MHRTVYTVQKATFCTEVYGASAHWMYSGCSTYCNQNAINISAFIRKLSIGGLCRDGHIYRIGFVFYYCLFMYLFYLFIYLFLNPQCTYAVRVTVVVLCVCVFGMCGFCVTTCLMVKLRFRLG